ncbi:glycosyltransferase [Hyphomicrobium sp. MC8b]|uniref:glycosyltransferase n=1 Tax=Hyphomicrobium sp. MC8b TaxID=300273 RepID=UPI00391AF611
MRIALLFRSFGPYHLARLRAAREHHDILALEHADLDVDYDWNVRAEKRNAGVVTLSSAHERNGWLASELPKFAPDAIAIPGYSEPFALSAVRNSRALKVPMILMSDTHAGTARGDVVRNFVKQHLIALFQSALVAGSVHARYLTSLGFAENKIVLGYDVVDNHHFAPAAPDLQSSRAPSPHFLACARFIEKKNLECLVVAFARYRQETPDGGWDLVVAGEGPLRAKLEGLRQASGYATNIHFIGHKTYAELPSIYRSAGAFVHPSWQDEWGLVVNEAMAAGLPVLVSKGAGCSAELVENGVNGFTFDPHDADGLAALMRTIATDCDRQAMGRASLRSIARWDVERFASGLSEAAQMAMQSQCGPCLTGSVFAAAMSRRA